MKITTVEPFLVQEPMSKINRASAAGGLPRVFYDALGTSDGSFCVPRRAQVGCQLSRSGPSIDPRAGPLARGVRRPSVATHSLQAARTTPSKAPPVSDPGA